MAYSAPAPKAKMKMNLAKKGKAAPKQTKAQKTSAAMYKAKMKNKAGTKSPSGLSPAGAGRNPRV